VSYVILSAQCCGKVAPVISTNQKTYKMSPNRLGVRADRDLWRFCPGMPCYVKGWLQAECTIISKLEGYSWPSYLIESHDGHKYTVSQLYLSRRPIEGKK
jgi:hypothetical protein